MSAALAPAVFPELDHALRQLAGARQSWIDTSVPERIAILGEIKERLMPVAEAWAEDGGRKSRLPALATWWARNGSRGPIRYWGTATA